MKHPLSTTAILIFLFIAAQIVGLALISMDIKDIGTDNNGAISVTHNPTIIGDRPQTTGLGSLLYIAIGVAVGTALMLLIIRFKLFSFWKGWFFFAVWLSTAIAFGVFMPSIIAFILCFVLAAWKIFYPNPWVHNLTEIFMYAGIALIIVPIFTLPWVIALLVIISIYDIIAVWHSKHMVTMADAQREQKLFAGLFVPKKNDGTNPTTSTSQNITTRLSGKATAKTSSPAAKTTPQNNSPNLSKQDTRNGSAILGGGDIAFPLIFAGVVMEWLIMNGTSRVTALYEGLIISLGATIALTFLFVYAKKDRYYPAMPYISAGCFAGLLVVWLIQLI